MNPIYVRMSNNKVKKTIEVAHGIFIDKDENEKIVGVEILDYLEIEKDATDLDI